MFDPLMVCHSREQVRSDAQINPDTFGRLSLDVFSGERIDEALHLSELNRKPPRVLEWNGFSHQYLLTGNPTLWHLKASIPKRPKKPWTVLESSSPSYSWCGSVTVNASKLQAVLVIFVKTSTRCTQHFWRSDHSFEKAKITALS